MLCIRVRRVLCACSSSCRSPAAPPLSSPLTQLRGPAQRWLGASLIYLSTITSAKIGALRGPYFSYGLRQVKVVHADACITFNYSTTKNRWQYSFWCQLMNLLNSSHPLSVVRWFHEPQSTMVCPEVRFPHCVGRYRLVGSPSWFAVCWNCRGMKGFLIRGWDLNITVRGATSTLDGGATLAARWLHEP